MAAPHQFTDRAPGAPRGPQEPPPVSDADLTFTERYPELWELVSPRIGVQYVLVLGGDVRRYQRASREGNSSRPEEWWDTIPNMPAITILGPKGTADTVVLLAKGKPARGAAEGNGKRRFFVDEAVEEITGLYADGTPPTLQNGQVSEEEIEAAREEKGKRPARSGVISGGAPRPAAAKD